MVPAKLHQRNFDGGTVAVVGNSHFSNQGKAVATDDVLVPVTERQLWNTLLLISRTFNATE